MEEKLTTKGDPTKIWKKSKRNTGTGLVVSLSPLLSKENVFPQRRGQSYNTKVDALLHIQVASEVR